MCHVTQTVGNSNTDSLSLLVFWFPPTCSPIIGSHLLKTQSVLLWFWCSFFNRCKLFSSKSVCGGETSLSTKLGLLCHGKITLFWKSALRLAPPTHLQRLTGFCRLASCLQLSVSLCHKLLSLREKCRRSRGL